MNEEKQNDFLHNRQQHTPIIGLDSSSNAYISIYSYSVCIGPLLFPWTVIWSATPQPTATNASVF